ncbi:MAG: SDR family NAD(P)-dependent oxidoreductase [Acetobacteraceae bacterium]
MHGTEAAASMDGIAIIGMAVRLPGAADVDRFWHNQMDGIGAIRRLDDDALLGSGFSRDDLADPALVRAFGVLDGIAEFDARFFGFPPTRAQALDPQQRLLLQAAWHAMEHAGYGPGTQAGTVGTYLSITQSSYGGAAAPDLADSFFALTSRDKDYAASRVAYKLDLTGPAMMIQSASSGSLAAVHAAVEALVSGQCDMALAGGCSIALPQGAYRHAPGLMLSASGTCRAFDSRADGTVPGNGLGVVVLKPVAQAMLDGDTIYAVIRGSALNNDGAQKTDYLAPSVQGQARVVGEALAVADVDPATIGYIETHGTGTLIGDPIEIRALSQIFRRTAFSDGHCALGSLKPSIGHLHVASGVAGLIRAALAVHHGVVPPSLNYAEANPELDLGATPFFFNTAACAWPLPGPRRAGVSAFGLGGTNVHVVLEQAPPLPPRAPRPPAAVPLVLSGKTPEALHRATAALAEYLRATPGADLADIAWTLAAGRQRFEHRAAVMASTPAEAIAALQAGASAPIGAGGAMADAARMWLSGGDVDWAPAFAGLAPRRVALPQYPFAPESHWLADAARPAPARRAKAPARRPGEADVLPWLQRLVADILRVEPDSLDPDLTYEAFGIDSLLVNSITQALQQRYRTLRATALFEYNTLRRLADHLAESGGTPDDIAEPAAPDAPEDDATDDAIAIIGMAGRYPGAPDLDAFWQNLRAGRDSITEVPPDRWDWTRHVDPDRKDRAYTRWGGFIADADRFDPLFFGISPREARLLDPQQRVFLEASWAAIENAGYTRRGLKDSAARSGGDVGVFVGVMHNAYRLLGMDAVASGLLVQSNHWSIANRVSYLFDFTGPSLAVDTACSASLSAVHLACESLRRGECGVAITGGVNLVLHPQQPLELCRAGMVSKGARCSAFGEAGDGFVQGEGVGVVVLKRLSAALADGDRIEAVIRGSAMNAGGKTSGYTVPNPRAQAEVVMAALRQAGVTADSIGCIECHGTGTSLGDPIEIAGLSDAFRQAGGGEARCAIGSVKSNIGHLEAAAGIAGLTKAVLQLRHAELVPSLHATPRNPRIDFASVPFAVQDALAPWPQPASGSRRAGVSSFGAGGANVHVVLQEAPPPPVVPARTGPWVVPLSARSQERLEMVAAALRDWLRAHPADIADVAFTLATGREAMEARVALVVRDRDDLIAQLGRLPDAGAMPAADEAAVADALVRRDLPVLARLWSAGARVAWARLFADGPHRRLALPTYPFLRERHWLPDAPAGARPDETRGLLGEAEPTLAAEARWRVVVDAANSVLAHHRVMGEPTLPGVATLALAAEAARRLGRTFPLTLTAVTWLRPLSAHADSLDARLVLREGTDGWRLNLLRDGVVHATAVVSTHGGTSQGPWVEDGRDGARMTAAALYDRLAERGLEYGPAFRTIRTVAVRGRMATATARAMQPVPDLLDPGLLDAALQLTSVLITEAGALPLPFAVGQVDIVRPPPAECRIMVRRLDDGAEGGVVRFDALIATMDGTPCVVFHDLAGRMPAARSAVPPCFVPVWVTRDATPEQADDRRTVVLADPGHPAHAAVRDALPGARFIAPDAAVADADRVVFLCAAHEASLDHLRHLIQRHADRAITLTVLAMADPAGIPPWPAAAFGLARVAAREHPAWSVRCVAVDTLTDVPAALTDPGDPLGREVLWRRGIRQVRALHPVRLAPVGQSARLADDTGARDAAYGHGRQTAGIMDGIPVRPVFRSGGVYLILGGAGGIGLELASHIATTFGARVALVGRTQPAPERQARIEALGGAVAFFAADATDGAALRRAVDAVRARFGPINGAIHSAIVMQDQALVRMSDAAFHAVFDVKAQGTINLVEALAGEALDWFALFSSANSFAANAGQANYVAGCAFKDAYAAQAAARLGCPVRVINWGFWGEVGRVADPAYRERLARRGVQPIATAEGLAAVEAVLGAGVPQVLVLKAEDRVLHELGVEEPAAPVDDAALAIREHAALDALTRHLVAAWAAKRDLTGVAPRHRRLAAALADLLGRAPAAGLDDAAVAAAEAAFLAENPALRPHAALLRRCIDNYDAVLHDRMPATEVLFPGSSMSLMEGIYRGDRLTTHCNALVAEAVRDAVSRAGRKVRVLEVGAGTGGTSAAVLHALAESGADAEYVYTDVSRAFALHGERQFGARYPFVRFGVLDLGRDPVPQGYDPGGFDIILGANVVHVTPDLAATMVRLRGLLSPGGTLVLYEMTALPDFATATFGLLDGWWAFTDRRLPHGPLLDAGGWSRLLRQAGFADVALRGLGGDGGDSYRHTVIVGSMAGRSVVADAARAPAVPRPDDRHPEPAPAAGGGGAPLVAAIRNVVAATLQMQPEQLAPDRNFSDYGADSIISVDLISALNERFGITLKPTILFSHATIERLAEHLAGHHGVRVAPPAVAPVPALSRRMLPEAAAEPHAAWPDRLTAALDPPSAVSTPAPAAPVRSGAWADDIAIIGVSGRFPGAEAVDAFWDNILAGTDSVGPVPPRRWDHSAVYDPAPGVAGRTQCPGGGFLDDVESFDPLFFNLSPNEATLMDPQQRLFLQEAWRALEDAGYAGPHRAHARCGVFVGTVAGDYDELLRQSGRSPDAQRFMGNAASMLAARIAYRLDLHGPCLSVDTACSSSLVAVQLACESLQRGESDLALAGGVAVLSTPGFYVAASSAGMLSPSGRCRTLDAGADGFVPGEAVAAVVLKRRADAVRDGDAILALIKGAGTNQDGASNGITAPNGAAQTALLRDVHQRFAIDPAGLGYVELHGTGTRLGDPIEMEALRLAFARCGGRPAIGSVKANIGHTLPAAGIAGLIKLALVLHHGRIPPLAQFGALNEHIDLDGRFDIPASARDWDGPVPRRGAVSSFGFSGTNAHVVLEEPPPAASLASLAVPSRDWHLAVFSGRDAAALDRVLRRMAGWLDRDGGRTALADICGTLARGRAHLPVRAAFVVRDLAGLRTALRDPSAPAIEGPRDLLELRRRYLAGDSIEWLPLYSDGSFHRRSLPTYPFERRRCWPVSAPPAPASAVERPASPSLFEAVIRELGEVS